tara:strand:+ start:3333 stop:3563 length:231 start_codon:yes stop_codon:yes gene_type:complete
MTEYGVSKCVLEPGDQIQNLFLLVPILLINLTNSVIGSQHHVVAFNNYKYSLTWAQVDPPAKYVHEGCIGCCLEDK